MNKRLTEPILKTFCLAIGLMFIAAFLNINYEMGIFMIGMSVGIVWYILLKKGEQK